MDRIGLGWKELQKHFERLIILDIFGYGQDTEYKDMKAYDLLIQAESGLCSVTGTKEQAVKVGVSIADLGTGMNAYSAVLRGADRTRKTGQGAHIELAMFDTVAEWMSVPLPILNMLTNYRSVTGWRIRQSILIDHIRAVMVKYLLQFRVTSSGLSFVIMSFSGTRD